MVEIMARLAQMDWDVGDQGRPEGFLLLVGKRAYILYVEGWGLECLDGCYASLTPKALTELKKLAAQWCSTQSATTSSGLYTGHGDDAAFVSFRLIALSTRDQRKVQRLLPEEDIVRLDVT